MTNLSHIASRVFNTPLMIDSKKLAAILAVLAPRLGVDPPAVEAALLAEQRSRKPYAVTDAGVAVIEVPGSLVNRASGMDAQSGLTSYEQLGNEILDAATDPLVKGILLRFDSYGGEANGAWDVASLIEEAARIKPVWASVDDWALSAGYLLASATDRIWVTRTGGVGSVGIIAMHLDQSGWDAANGLRYTTIYAGDRKNDFNPHEPLSEGARDVLVAEVDRLYGMFVDAVARRRAMNGAAVRGTEAGILYGEDAVARGFADRVGTFRDALAAMTASLSQPKFTKGGTTVSEATQAATSPPVPDLAAIEAAARFPSDEDWIERQRRRKVIIKQLGRGVSETIISGGEDADAALLAKIREGEGEVDPFEANRIVEQLSQAEVDDVVQTGDSFRVTLRVLGGAVTHLLKMPSAKDVFEYRRGFARVLDLPYNRQELTINLAAAGALHKKLITATEGYAGEPPIIHQTVAVKAAIDALDAGFQESAGPNS